MAKNEQSGRTGARGKPGTPPMFPSAVLAAIVGSGPLSRTEVIKRMWDYIKDNSRQDDEKRTMINADKKLFAVFGKAQVSMFEMTKLINENLKPTLTAAHRLDAQKSVVAHAGVDRTNTDEDNSNFATRRTRPDAPKSRIDPTFLKGTQYTRADIRQLLGLSAAKGGAWATGHVRHAGEHFIFCGIDTPGRTGQNYNNRFDGDQLVWHPRDNASLAAPVFADLVSGSPTVHVFYRENDRNPFTYAGAGRPVSIEEGPPIEVRWAFDGGGDSIAEEVPDAAGVIEGAKTQITVNAYERDPTAKPRCIKRWGTTCVVCDFDFAAVYGELGKGFIHVHHLKPIHTIGEEYVLDPENDLRPVCPNCHSMLHKRKSVLSIEELMKLLRRRFDKNFNQIR